MNFVGGWFVFWVRVWLLMYRCFFGGFICGRSLLVFFMWLEWLGVVVVGWLFVSWLWLVRKCCWKLFCCLIRVVCCIIWWCCRNFLYFLVYVGLCVWVICLCCGCLFVLWYSCVLFISLDLRFFRLCLGFGWLFYRVDSDWFNVCFCYKGWCWWLLGLDW